MEGGRFFIARADEITFTTHLVVRVAAAAPLHLLARSSPVCART